MKEILLEADIIVAALGKPEFVTADMVKEGAVVIDVGITRLSADNEKGYVIKGDVDYENVAPKCGNHNSCSRWRWSNDGYFTHAKYFECSKENLLRLSNHNGSFKSCNSNNGTFLYGARRRISSGQSSVFYSHSRL